MIKTEAEDEADLVEGAELDERVGMRWNVTDQNDRIRLYDVVEKTLHSWR